MLKKILGVLLVLGSCITGITQANCSNLSLPSWLNCLNVNTNGTTAQTNSISIDEKANFTMGGHNFAFFNMNNDITRSIAIGRKNGNLNVIVNNPSSYNTTGYFKVEKLNYCTYANIPNAGNTCISNNAPSINYDDFINEVSGYNLSEIFYSNSEFNNRGTANFCFGYEGLEKLYCIGPNWQSATMLSASYTKLDDITGYEVPFTPTNLGTSFFTSSPFNGAGPGAEGGPISCINIQTQIMLYGSKYNTGMCYTNGTTFSGVQIIQTGKQTIFELYPTLNDFRNALNIYSTYCNPNSPATPEYCQQQMSQYSEYTYQFYNYLQQANNNSTAFSVESQKLYQYCHLQLDYTEEEKRNNCKETVDNYYATGVNEETANGNPFEGVTERIENNIQIAVPQTGTVFDEFLEGDIWNISITDRYDNFMEIFHKITGLFKYRGTQEGIIPSYITGLIMLILLLALFKK